jgi:hypothetical protein
MSAEEADGAQRGAAALPMGTISASASSETFFQRVAMVRGGGRVSAVIELTAEPRQIATQTLSGTTVDVDLGPLAAVPKAQELNAPDGARLIDHISIRGVSSPDGASVARVRITLWRPAASRLRISGRRVYVDFDTPDGADTQMGPSAPTQSASQTTTPRPASAARRPPETDASARRAVSAAAARFEQLLPFLLSASQSSPDALSALSGSISELQSSLRAVAPDEASADTHELLSSAVGLAAHAVRADFLGDRGAEARQAAALFSAAQGELDRAGGN